MYLSTVVWRFKPGSSERVVSVIRDQVVPAARQVAGLRHLYTAALEADAYVSVLIYDSQAHAEQGFATLVPVVRASLGDDMASMERQSGEAIVEEHFG